MRTPLSLLLLILMLSSCPRLGDGSGAGELAYHEGRVQEALAAFTEAARSAGNRAPFQLLHNQALAAIGAGDLVTAEFAAEKAVARGGRELIPFRDFLLGSTAFARCEIAEQVALRPEADPTMFETALVHARHAAEFWQQAAASRDDWPAARRNVERALLKLADLQQKREAAENRRKEKQTRPQPVPQPDPPPPDPEPDQPMPTEIALLEAVRLELAADQVQSLFDRLDQKRKEKLALRRARRKEQRFKVERDW